MHDDDRARTHLGQHGAHDHRGVALERVAGCEPVDRLQPTTSWQPGQVVEDHYGIALPPDLEPGSYVLEIQPRVDTNL